MMMHVIYTAGGLVLVVILSVIGSYGLSKEIPDIIVASVFGFVAWNIYVFIDKNRFIKNFALLTTIITISVSAGMIALY